MKLFVTVKPNAKQNTVQQTDETHFRISVKSPPQEGRANEAVIQVLSDYFGAPKSRFLMIQGKQAKHKVVSFV